MANDKMELEGKVVKALPGAKFQVEIDMNGTPHMVTCTISGRLRQNFIKILLGDNVTIQVSPYDLSMGIITYRNR